MRSPFRTAGVGLVVFALSGLVYAQAPTPPKVTTATTPSRPAAQPQAAGDRLPVRRVVLYKSGVGYFEHLGRIRGNQTVTIDFTSGQLNDVLKSLTALDLDGGRVLGVRYNSEAGLDRRLSALRLPLGADTSRAEFFSALRGARLEVRAGGTRLVGRLLSVEQIERKTDAGVVHVDTLSIVTDAGEIQTFALDTGVSVRLMEADLTQEVGRYLSLIASARDQDLRRVSITTSGSGDRDLFVSYISEVPIWKPTYRIVIPPAGTARKPILQGWAIIDNTVGEDWSNVQLSLVAGAPQSFVQAISRPYYVQRPVVPLPQFVSFAPQTHQGALGTAGAGALAGTITDVNGGVLPGVTVRVMQGPSVVTTVTTNAAGRYSVSGLPAGTYTVQTLMSGFNTTSLRDVHVSGGMETVLNATMQIGRISQELTVTAAAPVIDTRRTATATTSGRAMYENLPSTYRSYDSAEGVAITAAAQQSDATGAQLGDLFEYKLKTPVTIPKNQSALVPILSGEVEAEKVSLWSPNTRGGRPLRAVWLTNGTGSTLDGGSFSVMDAEAFAGEGLMEPLKAGERRLLSYAVDLAMQVDAKAESLPMKFTRVRIARGVIIHEIEQRQRRVYTVRNEDSEARALVLEHPVRAGWKVGGTIAPLETTPLFHRFRVPIAAKTTATFTVDEVQAGSAEYSVDSMTDDTVAVLVKDQLLSAETEAALRRILAQKAEVARLAAAAGEREEAIAAIDRDQVRVRENLKALKGTPDERLLVQRYVKQLDEQENRLAALRKEVEALEDQRQKAQAELERLIETLVFQPSGAGGL